MSHLDIALAYANAGWPIFPLEPRGKVPLGKLVPHGLKDASLEEEIVRRWWAAEPQANIAIPTGIVFDVADIDSTEGLEAFLELCKVNNTDASAFPRARTGRGGRHVFMAPTGVGNRTGVLPGLDWRGKGGYVVVPDSVHPSGTSYEWIHKVIDSPPPCPEWLLALITRPVVFQPTLASQAAPEAYLSAAISAEMAKLRSTAVGQRNDQLNRSAFALGQMVGAGWLERGRAEAELRAAAHAIDHGREPGLTATIMSGLQAGAREPRQAPEDGFEGGIIRGAQNLVARTVVPDQPVSTGPAFYSAAELEHKEIVEPRAIVPGVLYVGLNMLAGKGKLGKSWLALAMALGVASGGEVLGSTELPAAEVLYLALEDTQRRLKVRIQKLWDKPKWPQTLMIAHSWPKLDEGGLQALEMWMDEHPDASLVIIDVWKRLRHRRGQNANLYDEDYEHLIPLQTLAQRNQVAVLVIHHTRKAGAEDVMDEISGTGGVLAAVDSCIILHRTRSEADGEMWITGRDLEEAHLALKFEDARWSLLGNASEVTASRAAREILETVNDRSTAWTPALTAQALGKPRSQIKALMHKMLTRGELRRGPNSTYLPPLTGVTVDSVDRVDRVDREVGLKSQKRSTVNAGRLTRAHVRARVGCPSCGMPAYSWQAGRRKCHNCGTFYDSPAGGTTEEIDDA